MRRGHGEMQDATAGAGGSNRNNRNVGNSDEKIGKNDIIIIIYILIIIITIIIFITIITTIIIITIIYIYTLGTQTWQWKILSLNVLPVKTSTYSDCRRIFD